MSPLDAWHVISANLAHLYRIRKTVTYKGYDDPDTEAEVIAYEALKEMEEREKKKDPAPVQLRGSDDLLNREKDAIQKQIEELEKALQKAEKNICPGKNAIKYAIEAEKIRFALTQLYICLGSIKE